MGKLVRALETGFYKGVRKRPGDVFELSDGLKIGKWMEEVTGKPPATPKPATPVGELTYDQLVVKAKAYGIAFEGNKKPSKTELLKAIKDYEGTKGDDLA